MKTKNTAQQLDRTPRRTKKKATVTKRRRPRSILDLEALERDAARGDDRALAANMVVAELKNLAELRCAAYGTTIDEEWNRLFDRDELEADIAGRECERRRSAIRLIGELEQLEMVRAIANGEREPLGVSDAVRWELRIRAAVRRLKEWGSPARMAN